MSAEPVCPASPGVVSTAQLGEAAEPAPGPAGPPTRTRGYRLSIVPDTRPPALRLTDVVAVRRSVRGTVVDTVPTGAHHHPAAPATVDDGVGGSADGTGTERAGSGDAGVADAGAGDTGSGPTSTAESTKRAAARTAEAEAFTRRLLPLLVEVFRGRRPPSHLAGWFTPGAHRQVMAVARRSSRSRETTPVTCGAVDGWFQRPGVIDVVARLTRDQRTIALALRVEWRVDSWVCTALDVGPWGFAFTAPLQSLSAR